MQCDHIIQLLCLGRFGETSGVTSSIFDKAMKMALGDDLASSMARGMGADAANKLGNTDGQYRLVAKTSGWLSSFADHVRINRFR
jgi:hypothetical protein